MNRNDFIADVAEHSKTTKTEVDEMLTAIEDGLLRALQQGRAVDLRRLGKFSVREAPARTGRNPRTGEQIKIPAKRVASLKPSKALRDRLNPPAPSIPRPAARGRR